MVSKFNRKAGFAIKLLTSSAGRGRGYWMFETCRRRKGKAGTFAKEARLNIASQETIFFLLQTIFSVFYRLPSVCVSSHNII